MTIYIDFVLFLNFVFDFSLLLTTNIVLKRNAKIFNLLLGAFIGSLSTLVLFFKINSIQLFIIKVYLSIIMNLFTFYYHSFKYTLTNISVFYVLSILLGGFLYLLNIEFSYKHNGFIFYNNGLSINIIFLFIISPVILYIYICQNKIYKRKIKNIYKVILKVGKNEYKLNGYLDTGNTLNYHGKMVVITNKKFKGKYILVPFLTAGNSGFMKCIKAKIKIKELGDFNVLLGYSENFKMADADILLNGKMEG